MSDTTNQPYQTLGKHLRYLREQQKESLADVSGAVEIDEHELEHIEAGQKRPAEDILMLLISHFNMQDQEAGQLWELAGYHETASSERQKQEDIIVEALSNQKSLIVVTSVDNRTMYTDAIEISADNAGVTMVFGQQSGRSKAQSVARLGMSYEHAAEVLSRLQTALLKANHDRQPKLLPPSTD